MKKIAVFFADGTEELEALTPVDVIRRTGAICDIVSISGNLPTGSHGIKIVPDVVSKDFNVEDYDALIVPGGMPGAINIANDSFVSKALIRASEKGILIASICASPAVVLAGKGLIKGKATCYPAPDFIKALGDNYTGKNVEIFDNVITANGPKSAMEFALEICKYLGLIPKF